MQIDQSINDLNNSDVQKQALQMVVDAIGQRHQFPRPETEYIAQQLFDTFSEKLGEAIFNIESDLASKDELNMGDIEDVVQKHGPEKFVQQYQAFLQNVASGKLDQEIIKHLSDFQGQG